MEPRYMKSVQHFMDTWPEGKAPCSFFVTGGGFSLLDIGKIPGASRVFADAYIAYHMLEEVAFLRTVIGEHTSLLVDGTVGFVSTWPTYWYASALLERHSSTIPDATLCVVNASLTTNRWRRGKNEAFIATVNRPCDEGDGVVRLFRYDINKLTEDEYNSRAALRDVSGQAFDDEGYLPPPDPINQLRLLEDRKVAEVALGIILENPSLVNLMEHGERVVPLTVPDDPFNHAGFGSEESEPWTVRP